MPKRYQKDTKKLEEAENDPTYTDEHGQLYRDSQATIVGGVIGAILSLLEKAFGFVAKHTWAFIVFASGLVGWWLMQKVKKSQALLVLVTSMKWT